MSSVNSILFDMPLVMAALFCSNWLDLKSLSRLDAACASNLHRPILHTIFGCNGFRISKYESITQPSQSLLQWLSCRQLAFEVLELDGQHRKYFRNVKQWLRSRNCRQLRVVSARRVEMEFLLEVLSHAPFVHNLLVNFADLKQSFESSSSGLCPLLTELSLSGEKKIAGDLLTILDCRKLQLLTIYSCPGITKEFANELAGKADRMALDRLCICEVEGLSDSRLARILRACGAQLRHLELADCKQLTGETFVNISETCSNLRSLSFSRPMPSYHTPRPITGAGSVEDAGLHQLSLACLHLTDISLVNVDGISDLSLRAVIQNVVTLQTLYIDGCNNLAGDATIVPHYSGAPSALRTLTFANCRSLRGVMNICQVCPQLEELRIVSCEALNYAASTHIFKHGTRLTSLAINYAYRVYGNDLDSVPAGNLPSLRHLDLEGCTDFTDDGMISVTHICPNLRQLQLKSCAALGSQAMEAIARNLNHLESLGLEGCERVRQGAVLQVLSYCSTLRALRLTWGEGSDITANLLCSMAALPGLSMQALHLQCFQAAGNAIMALMQLLDAHPALISLQLEGDTEHGDIGPNWDHLHAYTALLRKAYPARDIRYGDLQDFDHFDVQPSVPSEN